MRGGNASDDSFAMSNNILTTSTNRCLLAVRRQRFEEVEISRPDLLQELGAVDVPPLDGGRFRRTPDIVGVGDWIR